MDTLLLISITEAGKRCGVSRATAYSWAATGELPGVLRVNGRFLVHVPTMERELERRAVERDKFLVAY